MTVDLQGPANAPNSTTARPSDTRVFGANDTFFKDCTSPAANDGTKLQAGFMNGMLAQIRSLIRGNGNSAVPAPVVTEDNTDDGMMLKAVQHLIQRGQPKFGIDTGAANALVVALTPALAEYKAGLVVYVLIAHSTTGATTINVNGLGTMAVAHLDGVALGANDLLAGEIAGLVCDGTRFQKLGIPAGVLTANKIYYVDASIGSDTLYDGSAASISGSAGPFLTIQKAINVISKLNANGFAVTINAAHGTYAPFLLASPVNGTLTIIGDVGSPSSCLITSSTVACVTANGFGVGLMIKGFKVSNGAGSGAYGLLAQAGGTINFQNMVFDVCTSGAHIFCDAGTVNCFGDYTISGNATSHALVNSGGRFIASPSSPNTVTLSGTPGFVITYAANDLGYIRLSSAITTFSGSASVGSRYSVTGNSVIQTSGAGATYLPGTTSGATASGGQYL